MDGEDTHSHTRTHTHTQIPHTLYVHNTLHMHCTCLTHTYAQLHTISNTIMLANNKCHTMNYWMQLTPWRASPLIQALLVVSVMVAVVGCTLGYWWHRSKWSNHPIAASLSLYNQPWRFVTAIHFSVYCCSGC